MTNGLSGPRKQFLDVLRVLATCAVVLMHVLTGATDVTDASIVPEYRSLLLSVMDLVTWCVPIFLLISGYLFLNPERTLTYPVMIKKYCRRIALAILLFGVPYAASELVVAERTFRIMMIPEALKMTLTGHTWSHMWYLYLILFLYLITPLLKKVLRVLPVWGVVAMMAVIFLGSSVAPFLNKVLDVNSIPVLPDGGVYFLYYLCGYFFAVREVCVDKGRNVWLTAAVAVLALGIGESSTSHDTFYPLQPVEEIESLECKEEQAINHHDDERIPKVRTSKRAHARKQVVRTVTGQEQLEQIRLQESYCRHRASSHTRSVGEDVDSQSQGKTPQ